MPPKSKRRYDKKGSHRFVVMHRSHLDPLYDVPGASKMVLQPATDNPDTEEFLHEMQSSLDKEAFEKLKALKAATEDGNLTKKGIDTSILDTVNEYGFANDGYDYSQHTKEIGEGAFVSVSGNIVPAREVVIKPESINATASTEDALLANSSITASMEENERQFESIALSTEDMPDDVADALNGGEGFLELNDDFVVEASKKPTEPEAQVFDFDAHIKRLMRHADGIYSDDEEEEDIDFDASEVTGGEGDPNREARPQDVQFDAFLEHDYHDDTIGDLEDKITIEGLAEQMSGVTLEPGTYFEDIIDNYLENEGNQEYDDGNQGSHEIEGNSKDKSVVPEGDGLLGNQGLDVKDEAEVKGLKDVMVTVQMEQNFQDVEAMKKVAEKVKMTGDNKVLVEDAWVHNPRDAVPRRLQQKWDVESITSTYSNTDNHPKVLKDSTMKPRKNRRKEKLIKLSNKTGMPILEEEGEDEVGSDEEEEYVRVNKGVARNRKETKEEKKARKQALKAAKKARRQEKKSVKLVYKEETSKQLKAGVGKDSRSIYRIK